MVGRTTVLIDDDSGFAALSTAEHLAEQGSRVEIVTRFPHAGMGIYEGSFAPQQQRLAALRITITPNVIALRIEGTCLTLREVYGRGESTREADTFVLAMGRTAVTDLWSQLRTDGQDVAPVGDCVAPRDISTAVYEGHAAARAIDRPLPEPWALTSEM